MKKYNFIMTSDEETKSLLIQNGFKIVNTDNNVYTFLNESNQLHFDLDTSKIKYTNILCI